MSNPGEVHWSELMTHDTAAARAFYEKIAGWTMSEFPMPGGDEPYLVCMAGERPVAGIMRMTDEMGDRPDWLTYIHVADVDAACDATSASGGQVLRPPFDVPSVGRIAIALDPTGATIGLITPAEEG